MQNNFLVKSPNLLAPKLKILDSSFQMQSYAPSHIKLQLAQSHESTSCFKTETAELSSSGEKIRFQRMGGFYNNRNGG